MLLVILLEGEGYCRGGEVEGSQLLKVLDDLTQFSVGGRFDDVFLDFLTLLRHLINYDMTDRTAINTIRINNFSISMNLWNLRKTNSRFNIL